MARFARRVLALTALGAGLLGVVVAVASGLGRQTVSAQVGVAAAEVTKLTAVTRAVPVAGARVRVTRKPGGSVCLRAGRARACASSLGPAAVVFATAVVHGRQVVAGVAGARVRAVIARLTRRGTVWPAVRAGAFYALLPREHRLRAIVAVLAGGRRVAFRAT